MKQVEVGRVDLGGHYDIESFKYLLDEINKNIKDAGVGHPNVTIEFRSTFESYEDYLGSPILVIMGDRELNKEELAAELYEETIEKLAKDLGITFYEANTLMQLKNRGVI